MFSLYFHGILGVVFTMKAVHMKADEPMDAMRRLAPQPNEHSGRRVPPALLKKIITHPSRASVPTNSPNRKMMTIHVRHSLTRTHHDGDLNGPKRDRHE